MMASGPHGFPDTNPVRDTKWLARIPFTCETQTARESIPGASGISNTKVGAVTVRAILCDERQLELSGGPFVRWDLAWPLFLPDCAPGSLPTGGGAQRLTIIGRWFWDHMGLMAGRLRPDAPEAVWLVCPTPLSEPAREFVTRLASFWCDEVYWEPPTPATENRWTAPVVNVSDPTASPLTAALTETYSQGQEHPLLAATAVGRMNAKVQVVAAGASSARLHSHTAQDEYYLILNGSGTLRMGERCQPITRGCFIAKPTGPDLPSHILADQGEPVTILDMEVYADARQFIGAKDVMNYADQRELVMDGLGWDGMVPLDTLQATHDVFSHYFDGYERRADGTVTPRPFPGQPARPGNPSGA